MKKKLNINTAAFIALIFFGASQLQSCNGDSEKSNKNEIIKRPVSQVLLSEPKNGDQFITGEEMIVTITVNTPNEVSELQILVDNKVIQKDINPETQSISILTDDFKVGYRELKMTFIDASGKLHADTRKLIFFSDITPVHKNIHIVNTYPHRNNSYTQGLEFYKGDLYEGTGQYGQSILAKVDLNSGAILKEHALKSSFFGEGITILNDTIYQITWKGRTCFMYDMNFNQIGQFTYNGEGWGLTNDGEHIIMTRGDAEIVWRNPRTFEIVKTIHVFDNEKEIMNLNECELINDHLFINVYTESYLVEVDTATGKVLSKIDCFDLVREQPAGVDYLNGIAYNKVTNKIYITGKWWPKIYQIEIDQWEN